MSRADAAREAVRQLDAARGRPSFATDLEAARAGRSQRAGGEGFAITALTARELCALPDPPNTGQLLGPVLERGYRLVIGAHTGEGKTTLALSIIGAVVLQRAFLDWRGAGGRALVIDAEQGLKTIKKRLQEAGLHDCDAIDYVRVPDGLSLDRDRDHIGAVERLLGRGGYSVVLADPLYKLHTGDSNAEREAVDLMKRFDAWREQHGFALALPVHCRKPPVGAKFTMHEFFGATAYLRGAEVVIGLQRVRSGYAYLHFFKDRDGDLPIGERWGLLFDREQGFRRDPEDGKDRLTATEQVRELLEGQPGHVQEPARRRNRLRGKNHPASPQRTRRPQPPPRPAGRKTLGPPRRGRPPMSRRSDIDRTSFGQDIDGGPPYGGGPNVQTTSTGHRQGLARTPPRRWEAAGDGSLARARPADAHREAADEQRRS